MGDYQINSTGVEDQITALNRSARNVERQLGCISYLLQVRTAEMDAYLRLRFTSELKDVQRDLRDIRRKIFSQATVLQRCLEEYEASDTFALNQLRGKESVLLKNRTPGTDYVYDAMGDTGLASWAFFSMVGRATNTIHRDGAAAAWDKDYTLQVLNDGLKTLGNLGMYAKGATEFGALFGISLTAKAYTKFDKNYKRYANGEISTFHHVAGTNLETGIEVLALKGAMAVGAVICAKPIAAAVIGVGIYTGGKYLIDRIAPNNDGVATVSDNLVKVMEPAVDRKIDQLHRGKDLLAEGGKRVFEGLGKVTKPTGTPAPIWIGT